LVQAGILDRTIRDVDLAVFALEASVVAVASVSSESIDAYSV